MSEPPKEAESQEGFHVLSRPDEDSLSGFERKPEGSDPPLVKQEDEVHRRRRRMIELMKRSALVSAVLTMLAVGLWIFGLGNIGAAIGINAEIMLALAFGTVILLLNLLSYLLPRGLALVLESLEIPEPRDFDLHGLFPGRDNPLVWEWMVVDQANRKRGRMIELLKWDAETSLFVTVVTLVLWAYGFWYLVTGLGINADFTVTITGGIAIIMLGHLSWALPRGLALVLEILSIRSTMK